MKEKDNGCFTCTRAELLEALEAGMIVRWWKCGPMVYDKRGGGAWKELHPRRDTVLRLITDGIIVPAGEENDVQRECGLSTYRLAAKAPNERS